MDTEPLMAFTPDGVMASEQAQEKEREREGGSLGWALCILAMPAGSCASYQSVKGLLQILIEKTLEGWSGGVRGDLEQRHGRTSLAAPHSGSVKAVSGAGRRRAFQWSALFRVSGITRIHSTNYPTAVFKAAQGSCCAGPQDVAVRVKEHLSSSQEPSSVM